MVTKNRFTNLYVRFACGSVSTKKLVRCVTKCVYEETHPLAVDDAEVHAVLDVHVRLEQPPILRPISH